jgi:hypothetical protein
VRVAAAAALMQLEKRFSLVGGRKVGCVVVANLKKRRSSEATRG